MSISKINVNKPIINNGGTSMNSGDSPLMTPIKPGNTNKPSGSSSIIGTDTFKPVPSQNYPNNQSQPIIMSFTEEILGGWPVPLGSPSSWNLIFSPPNQLVDFDSNTITTNLGGNFMFFPFKNGMRVVVNKEDVDYFLSSLSINRFIKLCADTREQNEFPIYADPYGDSEKEVPLQWAGRRVNKDPYKFLQNPWAVKYRRLTGQGPLIYSNEVTQSMLNDWTRVSPYIDIYIYYTHKRTNIFLPGYGWKGTTCWGGHLCDNAEFDIHLKIADQLFYSEVNLNNTQAVTWSENSPTSLYIQNPTPHDRFFKTSIYLVNGEGTDYMFPFLTSRVFCDGVNRPVSAGGLLRLVSKSGKSHAPNINIFMSIDDKYIVWPGDNFYTPKCEDNDDKKLIPGNPNTIYINSDLGLLRFDPKLAQPTPSDRLFKINNVWAGSSSCKYDDSFANAGCIPDENAIPDQVTISIEGIKPLSDDQQYLADAINQSFIVDIDSYLDQGAGTKGISFRDANNTPWGITAGMSFYKDEDGNKMVQASAGISNLSTRDEACGGVYWNTSFLGVTKSNKTGLCDGYIGQHDPTFRSNTYGCVYGPQTYAPVVDTSEAKISVSV